MHPSASRRSALPALRATACSAPSPASCSASLRPLCSHQLSSGAPVPYNLPPGTRLCETGIAECARGSTSCKGYSMARDTSPPDQNPLRFVPRAVRFPDTASAIPTTPCYTPPASPARKTPPTAICPPANQTGGTPLFPAPAAEGNRHRRLLAALLRSSRFV